MFRAYTCRDASIEKGRNAVKTPLQRLVTLISACALIGTAGMTPSLASSSGHRADGAAHHVLLLSVDGMHQSDLQWWVFSHPDSALARLVRGGRTYVNASTPVPSDSFP